MIKDILLMGRDRPQLSATTINHDTVTLRIDFDLRLASWLEVHLPKTKLQDWLSQMTEARTEEFFFGDNAPGGDQ